MGGSFDRAPVYEPPLRLSLAKSLSKVWRNRDFGSSDDVRRYRPSVCRISTLFGRPPRSEQKERSEGNL